MGLSEFAFEDEGNGVDTGVSERGKGGESELAEHACGDVVGREAAVTAEQQVEGAAHPADAEAIAVEQQAMLDGEPLHGDEADRLP